VNFENIDETKAKTPDTKKFKALGKEHLKKKECAADIKTPIREGST